MGLNSLFCCVWLAPMLCCVCMCHPACLVSPAIAIIRAHVTFPMPSLSSFSNILLERCMGMAWWCNTLLRRDGAWLCSASKACQGSLSLFIAKPIPDFLLTLWCYQHLDLGQSWEDTLEKCSTTAQWEDRRLVRTDPNSARHLQLQELTSFT